MVSRRLETKHLFNVASHGTRVWVGGELNYPRGELIKLKKLS